MGQAAAATLVVGPRWIGDTIMAQVLFKALRASEPDRPIDVLAPDWSGPLLRRMPEVRTWIADSFPRRRAALGARFALGRSLRGRYDRAFVLPGTWKSAVVPFAAAIPRRTGYRGEMRYWLINDVRLAQTATRRKTATSYLRLANAIGDLPLPALRVDAGNQARLLHAFGLGSGSFVALAPGAQHAAKRWPVEKFAVVADFLAKSGLRPIVVGSAAEAALGQHIAATVPGSLDLCGKLTLEDVVDVLAAARLVVANDSGLMHVAAAVGTPLVAVYGATSPDDTPPLSPAARSVTLELACQPCRRHVCPLGHANCLALLETQRVLAAARDVGVLAAMA